MKLAFCLFKYFPYSGLSRDFLRVLLECKGRGHDIVVFASEWQGPAPEGVELTLLPARRWMNHSQNASFHRRLKAQLRKHQFDAIIGFNKIPGLDLYYGADYCYVGRAAPLYPRLYRLTPRYHNMAKFEREVFGTHSNTDILSLSEREKSVYQQFYATPDKRFHLLPPTLDRQRVIDSDRAGIRKRTRESLGLKESSLALMFIGSGFKTKGLDRAIEALAALPIELLERASLHVVGQDNERSFRKIADDLELADKVTFLGGRADIPELLMAGDLLIHPAYSENTGTVLLEAITAGLPVLATDVCGYATHIKLANAGQVLESPFDQNALNNSLANMLVDPDRERWSHNGLQYGVNPDLYAMPESAADRIEQWVNENAALTPATATQTRPGVHMFVRDDLKPALGNATELDEIMALDGEVYREAPGRRTIRLPGADNEDGYFLKAHTGVGWQEIIKNLSYFRLPVLGATNEWHGVHWLRRLGIDTMRIAGYATTGGNPAKRRSFLITEEISNATSLEDFCADWQENPPSTPAALKLKRWLIKTTATVARVMHASGANHRDFYLCHFLLKQSPDKTLRPESNRLYLIDLHRMQLRRRTPSRWIIKDLAGLYYSSMNIGLSQRDLLRFIRTYSARPLREVLNEDSGFWSRVETRAHSLYETEQRRAERRAGSDGIAKNYGHSTMSESVVRTFISDEGKFEHAGIRRRLLTHTRFHTKALERFMINPDHFCAMQGLEYLKQDRTTTIGVTSFDGISVVVKRYNARSPFHVVKRALRVSRAEHSWRNAQRLMALGIATPRPVAAVEERFGPVRRRAWYLSEFVDGILLSDWFANRSRLDEDDEQIVEQIARTFALMRDNGIAHGDTKATNWLIDRGCVYLLDLDAMRHYRNETLHRQRFERDIQRFLRNFETAPHLRAEFAARLEALTVSGA